MGSSEVFREWLVELGGVDPVAGWAMHWVGFGEGGDRGWRGEVVRAVDVVVVVLVPPGGRVELDVR